MSRSKKRLSIYTDKQHRSDKRLANKKVRKLPIEFYIPMGCWWKRIFNSWDICDWKTLVFEHEIRDEEDREFYEKGFRK